MVGEKEWMGLTVIRQDQEDTSEELPVPFIDPASEPTEEVVRMYREALLFDDDPDKQSR